jgi:hypothetical protein
MKSEPMETSELRQAFGEATVKLMRLAVDCAMKGNEEGKWRALHAAMVAFMKEHTETFPPEVTLDSELEKFIQTVKQIERTMGSRAPRCARTRGV